MSKIQQVVMTKKVATKWLQERSKPHYNMTIWYQGPRSHRLVDAFRSFRDGKIAMGGISPIPDLGIKENWDNVSVWSENRVALLSLKSWLEKSGYETTGVW